jgi:muramoyltetrapeptide carboxypeptidase
MHLLSSVLAWRSNLKVAPKPIHVSIIAPSSPVDKNLLNIAVQLLKSREFEVTTQPNMDTSHFLFAGPTARRQGELQSQLLSSTTDIIWCARGGIGSNELLPSLNKFLKSQKLSSKFFVGFSDITPVQNLLALNSPIKSIQGLAAAVPDFQNLPDKEWGWLMALLTQPKGSLENIGYSFFSGNLLKGEIVGGNLSMLLSLLGTPYDFSYDDKILFLEDVNEPFHRTVRNLNHLIQSDKLKNLKGLIFGKFNIRSCLEEELYLHPILNYFFSESDIPIVYNFPCGHTPDCIALPLNTPVRLEHNELTYKWE